MTRHNMFGSFGKKVNKAWERFLPQYIAPELALHPRRTAYFFPNVGAYSETFISRILARNPDPSAYFFGSFLCTRYSTEIPQDPNNGYTVKQVGALLRAARCDCALVFFGPTALKLLERLKNEGAQHLPVRIIPYFLGFDATEAQNDSGLQEKYQELFQVCDQVLAVSQFLKTKLIALGCSSEKIRVVPCGVELSFFFPPQVTRSVKGLCRFVAVGRFVAKKAPALTILAFSRAARDNPLVHLDMVGDGEQFEVCVQLVRSLRLEDKVTFHGPLGPERIRELYWNSHVFVQHSVVSLSGDSEGLPVAPIEAMATGLPVVVTRHAGFPEYVEDGRNGFMVGEFEIDAMAERLSFLASNPISRHEMGVRAAADARALSTEVTFGLLDSILGRADHGSH